MPYLGRMNGVKSRSLPLVLTLALLATNPSLLVISFLGYQERDDDTWDAKGPL